MYRLREMFCDPDKYEVLRSSKYDSMCTKIYSSLVKRDIYISKKRDKKKTTKYGRYYIKVQSL